VPIPEHLVLRLRAEAKGRSPEAPLLTNNKGERWGKTDHRDPVRAVVKAAGFDCDRITIYALRHTFIANLLVRGIAVKIVADQCDTSPAMIQAHYGKHIPADHTDNLILAAMTDFSVPPAGKVVPLR
jgi:integrase